MRIVFLYRRHRLFCFPDAQHNSSLVSNADLDTRRHDPAHFVRDLHLLRRRQRLQKRRQRSGPGDPLRPLTRWELFRGRSPCRAFRNDFFLF